MFWNSIRPKWMVPDFLVVRRLCSFSNKQSIVGSIETLKFLKKGKPTDSVLFRWVVTLKKTKKWIKMTIQEPYIESYFDH